MIRSLSLIVSASLISESSAKVGIYQGKSSSSSGVLWRSASRLSGGTKSYVGSVEYIDIPAFATDHHMMRTDMAITDSGENFKAECTNEGSNGDCYLFYSLGEEEPIRYKQELVSHGFTEGECAPRAKDLWGDEHTSMTTFYRRLPLGQKVEFSIANYHSYMFKAVIFSHQEESDWVCHGKSSSVCEKDAYAAGHEFAGAPLCVWKSGVGCERNWCPSAVPPPPPTAAAAPTVFLNGDEVPGVGVAGATSLTLNGASLVLPLRDFLQPTSFHGMQSGVQTADELKMVCPPGVVGCLYYLITFHCPPFSTGVNGGIPSLAAEGWEVRSFGPNFRPAAGNGDAQPTIIFRKEVQADDFEEVKFDRPGTFVAVFSQTLPGLEWDEAKAAFTGPFTAKTCKPIQ